MQITSFTAGPDNTALLNDDELIVDKIAAVNVQSYYQKFVYIQTSPSQGTGLYSYSHLEECVTEDGYADEEFAIYNNHFITRREFDDGAAVIDGEPIDVRGEATPRRRYLTPFNFLVAAQNSPINNDSFDEPLADLLDGILKGKATITQLAAAVRKLPKRAPLDYELG
jgi:hypothetical protein